MSQNELNFIEEDNYEDIYVNEYENEYEVDYNDKIFVDGEELEINNDIDLGLKKTDSYAIIKDKEIEKLRNRIIKEAMEATDLSRDDAILALIFFHWSIEKLNDKWYDNTEFYRQQAGIDLSKYSIENLKKLNIKPDNQECYICYSLKDDVNNFVSLSCKHYFCGDCWIGYLTEKAADSNTVLISTCPQQDCNLSVPESLFNKFLVKDLNSLKNVNNGILKNFIDHNSNLKWCPAPNCGAVVSCDSKVNKEIDCACGYNFCFKCGLEGHRPCPCEVVDTWDKKNNDESGNVQWLKINTKLCPNCKKFIEKNQGCDHMTCRKEAGGCGHEFCWLCFSDWNKHKTCNKYEKDQNGLTNDDKENIKADLQRYMFYFERFQNHSKALKLAIKQKNSIEYSIHLFNSLKNIPFPDLIFLREGVETIIKSRRLLKNSYIFGYYLGSRKEKDLFEHLQSLLEKNVNRLHELLENETMTNIMALSELDTFNKEFLTFRNCIIDLYTVTNRFIDNLLSSIENTMMHLIEYNKNGVIVNGSTGIEIVVETKRQRKKK